MKNLKKYYRFKNTAMTLEEKKLSLINFTEAQPYTMRPTELSRKFRLPVHIVYMMCNQLNLHALGFKKKNDKYYLGIYIQNNPLLTAQQVGLATGCTPDMVYKVGKSLGHRFETKHTQRTTELRNAHQYN